MIKTEAGVAASSFKQIIFNNHGVETNKGETKGQLP